MRSLVESLCFAALFVSFSQAATFNKDIAPILYEHCAACHHAGGLGPFPLISYSDVRKHGSQIADVTARRYMPPWPPQHGYGDFADERSLTDVQIAIIADWVKSGMPEGDSADLPAAPQFTSEWQMGKPDLILRMTRPFPMPASGSDLFRNFIIPSGVTEPRYIRGFELRLSNTRVVHHANVVLDRTQSLRARDGKDGQPGFAGMDVITEAAPNSFDPDSHFLFWKPGSVLKPDADDMSWRLDPGTDLIVNLHLQPTGKPESVQAEIGLYFANRAPTRFPMLLQLEHDGAIHIPPGSRSATVSDFLVLPIDVDALAIYPHAHYLGKLIEAWATLPDGTRKWLIRIPDWDINWQAVYEFRNPIPLPKGTKVEMRVVYDNSVSNPRNPNKPLNLVVAGDRSQDEMGHVWLQVLPKTNGLANADPRLELQEALMKRRLEKYPADFLAHYNLGALEQMKGNLPAAEASYRDALKVEPGNSTAQNGLAAALLMDDKIPQAIAELRNVLARDPSYLNARYNLARALAATGQLDEAATEYKIFLRDQPNDPDAQAGLGSVYFLQHDFADAVPRFQEALRIRPNDADIAANLGTALAITGHLPQAIQAFEDALRINPDHQAAKANLERARAQLANERQVKANP